MVADKNPLWKRVIPLLGTAALFGVLLFFVLTAMDGAGDRAGAEGIRIVEESIRRAAVSCYAAEGAYPPSFSYLKEHYGVSVNETRYAVHYEIFASNIMPEIAVTEKEGLD